MYSLERHRRCRIQNQKLLTYHVFPMSLPISIDNRTQVRSCIRTHIVCWIAKRKVTEDQDEE